MSGWDAYRPVTFEEVEELQRCVRGASGLGSLDDFAACFGDASDGDGPTVVMPDVLSTCGCAGCESRAGQSSPAALAPPGSGSRASGVGPSPTPTRKETMMQTTFTEDEDAAYERYLRATGRDPATAPSLANGSGPRESDEVLRHVVQRGIDAEEELRRAGFDPSDLPDRAYSEDWTATDESVWRQWKALTA